MIDLSITLYPGNSNFNLSDKPKFIDAFRLTIWFKPSTVRWALLLIKSIICLKKKKSTDFWVNNGYFSKRRISLFKSFIELIM